MNPCCMLCTIGGGGGGDNHQQVSFVRQRSIRQISPKIHTTADRIHSSIVGLSSEQSRSADSVPKYIQIQQKQCFEQCSAVNTVKDTVEGVVASSVVADENMVAHHH